MKQMHLGFDVSEGTARRPEEARPLTKEESKSEFTSLEENQLQSLASTRDQGRASRVSKRSQPSWSGAMPWPACLAWDEALAYSGVSPRQLRRWEKVGALRFRRFGRSGSKVTLRTDLDRLITNEFRPSSGQGSLEEDFDFG